MGNLTKYCYGISSFVPIGGKHILMLDYDNGTYDEIIRDIKLMQTVYNISDVYLIKSSTGYNALSLDKFTLFQIYQIQIGSLLVDRDFVLYGYDRGYHVLRFDSDKILEKVMENNGFYKKSNAHREFLNFFFDLKIEKDERYDVGELVDIIKYPSDKNGYHLGK